MWAIPNGVQPTKGSWEPADENMWYEQGKKLLSTLTSSVPMVCARAYIPEMQC